MSARTSSTLSQRWLRFATIVVIALALLSGTANGTLADTSASPIDVIAAQQLYQRLY